MARVSVPPYFGVVVTGGFWGGSVVGWAVVVGGVVVGVVVAGGVVVVGVAGGVQAAIRRDSAIKQLTTNQRVFLFISFPFPSSLIF